MFAASKSGSADAKDAQFKNVTMLLHGNGTNGAQNNTFLDSSTNNFSITRNGNTTQGTFTPYGSNWSNYFDGANTALNQNSSTNWKYLHNGSTWTIEFDIFPQTTSLVVLASTVKQLSNIGFTLQLNSVVANDVAFYFFNGSSYAQFSSTGNIVANQWNHVGITFDGSTKTCTFYINGVQRGSSSNTGFSYSASNSTYGLNIGCEASSYLYDFTGYLSNLRISTVVRSGMTTVPTTPYTNDANTSLLTCQSNRFVDNSSNAYTLDINGSPSVQRFSPFAPLTVYNPATNGGSGYFDGTGDQLTVANNSAFDVGSGNFTVEAWVYLTSTSGSVFNYSNGQTQNSNFAWEIYQLSATSIQVSVFNNNTQYTASSTSLVANAWNHVAAVRNGNTLTIYVNGVAGGTTASVTGVTVNNPASSTVKVSGYNNSTNNITGYVTDARMVKGTAVYTANFTPPTAPLTAITNTQLLLNYTNAGILDNAMMNDLETVGNAQISTSVKKYGTGSMYFDGTGDYLTVPSSPNLAFGSGDFTVEAWVYLTANIANAVGGYLADFRNNSTLNFTLGFIGNSGVTKMYDYVNDNGATSTIGTSTVTLNTWHHVAWVRSGTTVTMYFNGTANGTMTSSYSQGPTGVTIGARYTGVTEYITGYIDDLRITKGVARYTTTFTPPTAAFPDKG